MSEAIREGVRTWLRLQPAQISSINIQEALTFEANVAKNRIWYRGDSYELSQLYSQISRDPTMFWAAVSTAGMEIQKIHVGIPDLVVDILASIVVADLNKVELSDRQEDWDKIDNENKFKDLIKKAITDTLITGDGAFKISIDPSMSQLPILEFYPADKVEIKYKRGRVDEITFLNIYTDNAKREFVLKEHYGFGYVKYELYHDGKLCDDVNMLPETAGLVDATWADHFMMAEPLKFYDSSKWEGRGKSIFDSKVNEFSSLDEIWSQWMDALRASRTKEYIPENMLPRNPETGEILKPNAFDHRYIKTDAPMTEGAKNIIDTEQGDIPHESYQATYITALDLCLQGLISPSTLGIDVKKLDNAEAQREKEKATLYTRNNIVEKLQTVLPALINSTMKAYDTSLQTPVNEIKTDVTFGEYANPSFESQVETISKAKTGGIMSIEASVDELYGDTKDEDWKAEEVARLKAEQGVAELEEPTVNTKGLSLNG